MTLLQSELKVSVGWLAFISVPCLLVDFSELLDFSQLPTCMAYTLCWRSRRDLQVVWPLLFLSLPILPHPFPEICCENKTSQKIAISTSLRLHAAPNGCYPNSPLYLPCSIWKPSVPQIQDPSWPWNKSLQFSGPLLCYAVQSSDRNKQQPQKKRCEATVILEAILDLFEWHCRGTFCPE